jgi:hypothetical protein
VHLALTEWQMCWKLTSVHHIVLYAGIQHIFRNNFESCAVVTVYFIVWVPVKNVVDDILVSLSMSNQHRSHPDLLKIE